MIYENQLPEFLISPEGGPDSSIGDLASPAFSVVERSNSVTMLGALFNRTPVVLVVDENHVAGIITKIDYIDYVSSKIN